MTYLLSFIDNHMLIYYNPINKPSEWFSYGSDGFHITPRSYNNFENGKYITYSNKPNAFVYLSANSNITSTAGGIIKYSGIITNIGGV